MSCARTDRSSSTPPKASIARRCTSPRMRAGEGLVGLIAERGGAARALRRAIPSRLLLPAGDGRGDLPLLPRRADPARRRRDGRARHPEPRLSPLQRGGDRVAADHRHDHGGDDRGRRAEGARGARRLDRPRPADPCASAWRSPMVSASAMPCCTSRASPSPT